MLSDARDQAAAAASNPNDEAMALFLLKLDAARPHVHNIDKLQHVEVRAALVESLLELYKLLLKCDKTKIV